MSNPQLVKGNTLSFTVPVVEPEPYVPDATASFPVLQTPTDSGIVVVWAVSRPATGYVEWGATPNLGNVARGSVLGLNPYEDRILSIPIAGLSPNTRYFYRTVTIPIDFQGNEHIYPGTPIPGEIYSFSTSGPHVPTAKFVVINDTHNNKETLAALARRLPDLKADYTLWNGDFRGEYESVESAVDALLKPVEIPFAAEKPLLMTSGNHEFRGPWARNLSKVIAPWPHENSAFRPLERNFVVRRGPVVLIGLDTGEDKPDDHPVWGGLADFEPYRKLQTAWLQEVLKSPQVNTAPFVVALCHIPLFDSDPNANPGDLDTGYANYQRPCQKMWAPLLNQYGVQLLITGHEHKYRADLPDEGRTWTQLVGGGPSLAENATLITGKVNSEELIVTVEKLADKSMLHRFHFSPRKVGLSVYSQVPNASKKGDSIACWR
ncbi:MAG: metallophosphoesterase [Planctomycetia bacterium]|nr:metallophosphoesterase [Planctomycetia bacterium]